MASQRLEGDPLFEGDVIGGPDLAHVATAHSPLEFVAADVARLRGFTP
jgi:hypothetical protein